MSIFPKSIVLVGAGKMGGALLHSWIKSGISQNSITVIDKFIYPQNALDNIKTIPECIVIAVKPQSMDEVALQLKQKFGDRPLYISIAAGKTITYYEQHIGKAAIVRVMPNTPALIGKGISALYANAKVSATQKQVADTLLKASGEVVWMESEAMMDTVTAISGSGPAYVFLFLEALIEAGKKHGLSEDICQKLAIETLIGSAELAKASKEPLSQLRANVTSEGGTTQAALSVLLKDDSFKSLLDKAVSAAIKRGQELAQ